MKTKRFVGLGLLLALALFLLILGNSVGARRIEETYGITVLNVDADSGAPLAGWAMKLHAGPGCTDSPIQIGLTGIDGLVRFADLEAGLYSVQEILRPGYANVAPLCQDVTLAPSSPIDRLGSHPDSYPPGGDDTYAGGASLVLQLGTQPVDVVTLNGPLAIHRGEPGDANRNGLTDVQMQVMSMTLSGDSSVYGPITLRHQAQAAGRQGPDRSPSLQTPPWTPREDYLIVDNGVVAEEGVAASFGGHNDVTCVTDMRLWEPGGALGTWTDLAPLPGVLDAPRGVLVGGNIYVPGGWDCAGVPQPVLYIYDIAADAWSLGAAPPSGRAAYGIAAVGDQLYRIGGCADAGCTPSSDVHVYDIASDTWSVAASYPIPIAWHVCGTIEGQIYCAGGYDGIAPTHKAYRYTPPPFDEWDDPAVTDLCHQWWAMGAGDNAIDVGGLQSLYVYGGVIDGFDDVTDQAVHYDLAVNTWYFFEPLNFAVYRQGGGSANNPLGNQYSVGGLLPANPPGVGFTLDSPLGDYYVQHYPTIPPIYSVCAGPPALVLPDGLLEELLTAIPFPAAGRFDLSFYLDVGGRGVDRLNLTTFYNMSPLQVQGTVGAIPMDQEVFIFDGGSPHMAAVPLYDSSGQPAGSVQRFNLVTMAPGDTLVTFANQQTGEPRYVVYLPLVLRE